MTKEQLYVKWLMTPYLKSDIEAVIATEIANVKENKPQPAKPFDKERFERLFCASIGIGKFASFSDIILSVETTLQQLDAYYASKEGGNNG